MVYRLFSWSLSWFELSKKGQALSLKLPLKFMQPAIHENDFFFKKFRKILNFPGNLEIILQFLQPHLSFTQKLMKILEGSFIGHKFHSV